MDIKRVFVSYKFENKAAVGYYSLFREAVKGIKFIRAIDGKQLSPASSFSNEISSYIRSTADCLIGIFTDANAGNILFEIGVAVGAEKEIILIAPTLDHVPSMLRHYAVIVPSIDIAWRQSFETEIEMRLRSIFKVTNERMIENKLIRRYESEKSFFADYSRNAMPIKVIKDGDLGKAATILSRRLKANEVDLDSLFLLGDVYYLEGCSSATPATRSEHFRRQIKVADRGLTADGGSILLLHLKAAGHLRLGEFPEAWEALGRLFERTEKFAAAQYNAACLAAIVGDKETMLKHLRRTVDLDPEWKRFAKEDSDFIDYLADVDWGTIVYC